jgi:hypothetical protein
MARTQIRSDQILDETLTTDDIKDGTIIDDDISSVAAIHVSKLNLTQTVDTDILITTSGTGDVVITSPRTEINDVLNLNPIASAPGSPVEGDVYANSTDHKIYSYLNSSWVDLTGGSSSFDVGSGTSFPGSPSFADEFYRTDLSKWYKYNGTAWVEI